MKVFLLLVPVAFVLSVFVAAFGLGNRASAGETETRPVSDFTRVDLGGHGEMLVRQGETESLTIEAERQILDRIVTEVRGETLFIRMRVGFWDWWRVIGSTPPRYTVTMRQIEGLDLSGSGEIRGTDLEADALDLSLGGSGQFVLRNLSAASIDSSLAGSGRFELTGSATQQTFQLIGSGQYDASGLETNATSITIMGSGDVRVWATETLNVEILGSGSVHYRGDPEVTQRILGSGSVQKE